MVTPDATLLKARISNLHVNIDVNEFRAFNS